MSQALAKIGLRGRISRIFDRRRVASLCSIQQKRGAAVWMEPRQCQGGQKKDKIFLCMLILFPLLFSLLPSASLSPCFPPKLHPTVFPSRKSTVVSPAHRLGVTFYKTPLTTITRDVFISVNQSDWKAPLIHSSAPELFHQAFFMEKATMDTVQKDQKV